MANSNEIWKIIKNFSRYEVSNFGNVRNVKTKRKLKIHTDSNYYVELSLKDDNNDLYTKKVHRLVAEAFIPNTNNCPTVNHKDFDKSNNNLSNLEWMTFKQQMEHVILNKKCNPHTGREVSQFSQEGKFIKKFPSVENAMKELKLTTIRDACKGRCKTAGGFIFKYTDETNNKIHNEIWKKYDDKIYLNLHVSNFGRIKLWSGKITNGFSNIDGYKLTTVKNAINGKSEKKLVHRLVADLFLEPPTNNTMTINHIDGKKENNKIDNLEWATPSQQLEHTYKTGLRKNIKKVAQYDMYNNVIKIFNSISEASRETGANINCISKTCNGKAKIAGGYIWKFVA
jgi:hypothetical protein